MKELNVLKESNKEYLNIIKENVRFLFNQRFLGVDFKYLRSSDLTYVDSKKEILDFIDKALDIVYGVAIIDAGCSEGYPYNGEEVISFKELLK